MTPEESLQTVRAELEAGIALLKCQKCGCMESALKNLAAVLPTIAQIVPLPLQKAYSLPSRKCALFNTLV